MDYMTKVEKEYRDLKKQPTDNLLDAIRNLKSRIADATGCLPQSANEKLANLAVSYSAIDTIIQRGLTDTSAIAMNFVVEAINLLRNGAESEEFSDSLLKFDYLPDLKKFTEKSEQTFKEIYDGLMTHGSSEKYEQLLKKKTDLDEMRAQKSKEIRSLSHELATASGKFESAEFEIKYCNQAQEDANEAKRMVQEELHNLKERRINYKVEVENHKDIEKKRELGPPLQQNKYIKKGEQIAQEILSSLNESVGCLEKQLETWDDSGFAKRQSAAIDQKSVFEAEISEIKKRYESAEKTLRDLESDRIHTTAEIDDALKTAGTSDPKSLQMLNELAKSVMEGAQALQQAENEFRIYSKRFNSLSKNKKELYLSILAAFKLLLLADEYNGTDNFETVGFLCDIDEPTQQRMSIHITVQRS